MRNRVSQASAGQSRSGLLGFERALATKGAARFQAFDMNSRAWGTGAGGPELGDQ